MSKEGRTPECQTITASSGTGRHPQRQISGQTHPRCPESKFTQYLRVGSFEAESHTASLDPAQPIGADIAKRFSPNPQDLGIGNLSGWSAHVETADPVGSTEWIASCPDCHTPGGACCVDPRGWPDHRRGDECGGRSSGWSAPPVRPRSTLTAFRPVFPAPLTCPGFPLAAVR